MKETMSPHLKFGWYLYVNRVIILFAWDGQNYWYYDTVQKQPFALPDAEITYSELRPFKPDVESATRMESELLVIQRETYDKALRLLAALKAIEETLEI